MLEEERKRGRQSRTCEDISVPLYGSKKKREKERRREDRKLKSVQMWADYQDIENAPNTGRRAKTRA